MTTQNVQERTGVVTFKGKPMTLQGPALHAGDPAPDFDLAAGDLAHVTLDELVDAGSGRPADRRALAGHERLFARVAQIQPRLGELPAGVTAWVVSMDLPFAQARWAGAQEGDVKLAMLSDFRNHSFGRNYGLLIGELGSAARAIVVIGKDKTSSTCRSSARSPTSPTTMPR